MPFGNSHQKKLQSLIKENQRNLLRARNSNHWLINSLTEVKLNAATHRIRRKKFRLASKKPLERKKSLLQQKLKKMPHKTRKQSKAMVSRMANRPTQEELIRLWRKFWEQKEPKWKKNSQNYTTKSTFIGLENPRE